MRVVREAIVMRPRHGVSAICEACEHRGTVIHLQVEPTGWRSINLCLACARHVAHALPGAGEEKP